MNEPRPDVSVVIPCYNGMRFVGDAVSSVLSQQGGTVEVVVVDDGSGDGSAQLVADIPDPRVRLLRHDRNRGIAAARNTGLGAARGPFVAFLDQDDFWRPGRLAAQLGQFRSDDVGLVFCDVRVEDARGRVRRARGRVPRDVHRRAGLSLVSRLVADNFVVLGASLIRRRCIDEAGGFDESIRGGSDDFDLILRVAQTCRFVHLPRALFTRRLHGENYTRAERMLGESIAVIDRLEQRHPELRRSARIGRGRKLYRLARDRHAAGARVAAAADFRRALDEWPWQPRAWLGRWLCALGPTGDALSSAWQRARRLLP